MKIIIYIITVFFIAAFAGCSKQEVNKDVKPQTEDIKTKNGNVVSSNDKLPEGFPSDIPIYKDSKILSSTIVGKKITVTFEINDKAKAVGDFYKQEMPKSGYEADKDNDKMSTDTKGILTFSKAGNVIDFTYNYKEDKGKTILTVLVR